MTKEEENSILDQIRLSLKEYAFGDINGKSTVLVPQTPLMLDPI